MRQSRLLEEIKSDEEVILDQSENEESDRDEHHLENCNTKRCARYIV